MQDWWRGAVIYQIYPRSFQDSNGDGIGDLPGITARLEHVARLGADAIWLSPIFRSPMDDMGYDVADYTDIDPLFGALADFDALVARAHALGLKVIIDQVLSHSSDRHAWFRESRSSRDNPKADWYVWADALPDGSPPNNWLSVFGGSSWEWDSRRRQYYLHNFLPSQPDLNFHNPAVQDALLETMAFWLERGVDGFRLDVVNFYFHDAALRANPPLAGAAGPAVNPYDMQDHRHDKSQPETIGFLTRMRALLDRYGDRMLVGEIGDGQRPIELMSEYTRGSDRLHMAYSFEFLREAFGAAFFRSRVEAFFAGAPDGWPCWSFSNHDVIRHASRWQAHAADPKAFARQMAALLLSLEGSVCLYQGEELGLPEADILYEELTDPPGIRFWPEYKGRDGCRTPMPWDPHGPACGFSTVKPWLPVKAPHRALTVADEEADPGSTLAFYRAMIAWRRQTPALRAGRTRFFATDEPVLAFARELPDGTAVACVFNLGRGPAAVGISGLGLVGNAPGQGAALEGGTLSLGPNGLAFLAPLQAADGIRIGSVVAAG
jgi:alpha-glucosidase